MFQITVDKQPQGSLEDSLLFTKQIIRLEATVEKFCQNILPTSLSQYGLQLVLELGFSNYTSKLSHRNLASKFERLQISLDLKLVKEIYDLLERGGTRGRFVGELRAYRLRQFWSLFEQMSPEVIGFLDGELHVGFRTYNTTFVLDASGTPYPYLARITQK